METKFQLTLKEVVYLASLLLTGAGAWFSLESKVREYEVAAAAAAKIHALEMRTLEAKVQSLESHIADLRLTFQQQRRK